MQGTASEDRDQRDARLLREHREGRAGALEELLVAYQDRLYGVCLRMLGDREAARDLAQDAMVKIIQGLDTFDGRAKLSTWMIRVTMNACLSELRKLRLRRHASLDAPTSRSGWNSGESTVVDAIAGVEPPVSRRVEDSEDRADVSSALALIPPEQRAILILRDMQDLDYKTIGELLDIPGGTVKSRIFRARVALRERLEGLRAQRSKR
ncbi:MAG: sigma-70 family RNA polymerase sigma factor [Planctomycetota bacterium]